MIFIILTLFSIRAVSQDLIVRSSSVSPNSFSQFIRSNPQHTSLVDLVTKKTSSKAKSLEAKYKKALFQFLQASPQKADEIFKEVIDQAYHEDWGYNSRKLINYSYFRLAQLNEVQFDHWLEAAFNFDRSIKPDSDTFSPPFQKKWLDLLNQSQLTQWHPRFPREVVDVIFINGKKYQHSSLNSYPLNKDKNRVTVVSNLGFTQSLVGRASLIESKHWVLSPVAQGLCSDNIIKSQNIYGRKFKVLFPNNCVLSSLAKNNDEPIQPKTKLVSSYDNLKENSFKSGPLNNRIFAKSSEKSSTKKSTWYKNKWLWLGVAISGYIIYDQNQKDDQPQQIKVKVRPSRK